MKTALLVMTYGSPLDYTFEGIAEFFTNIRDGRRPEDDEIQILHEKYKAIGSSPLQKITKETVEKLKSALGEDFSVYYANKFSEPRINNVVKKMEEDGVEQCLCLILEPHYSMYSVVGYEKFIYSNKIRFNIIRSWNKEPKLIQFWAEEIFNKIKFFDSDDYQVIFTAHSIPEIAKEFDDSYIFQINETIDEIVKSIPVENLNYARVWQSESDNGMDWIKPDVLEYLKENGQAYRKYIFAPIGFISDHIETYYDIDVECKSTCEDLDLEFHRIPMPNNDSRLIAGLVNVIKENMNNGYLTYELSKEETSSHSIETESELKMPDFVKRLIEKKGRENVKMPEYVRKMLIKAGKIKE